MIGLSDDLASNQKLFVEDISLFSLVENITKLRSDLNNDLAKIRTWAFQLKMNFNPYLIKQAQEGIFSGNFKNSKNFKNPKTSIIILLIYLNLKNILE